MPLRSERSFPKNHFSVGGNPIHITYVTHEKSTIFDFLLEVRATVVLS